MLKISLLDLLLRVLPESFLFVIAGYLFSHKKFDGNRIIVSTIILSIVAYIIRLFPIQFGVHTILNVLVYTALCIKINKIPFAQSISYSLILTIMLSLCEELNIVAINYFLKQNAQNILNNDLLKNLYIIPSVILFLIGILVCYKLFYRKKIKEA